MGGRAQQRSREGRLALHHRRRPDQAPETLSPPLSTTREFTYDNRNNITEIEIGSLTYEFLYDDAGRLVKVDHPDTGVMYFEYDPAGNLVQRVHPAADEKAEFDYDAENRMEEARYYDDAQSGTPVETVTYEYDDAVQSYGAGRLTETENDASDRVEFTYDAQGRIVQEDIGVLESDGQTWTNYPIEYEFDALGKLQEVLYPSGNKVVYTYDVANPERIETVDYLIWDDGIQDYVTESIVNDVVKYDAAGKLQKFTRPIGRATKHEYDLRGLVFDGYNPSAHTETDKNGNVTLRGPGSTKTHEYSYDALNRVTESTYIDRFGTDYDWTYDDASDSSHKFLYTYDSAGRVTSIEEEDSGGTIETQYFVYDARGRLIEFSIDEGQGAVVEGEYSYDVRGRRLHRNGDRFVYNQWGDLIAIYQYDEVAEEYELGYEYAYLPVDVDVPGDGRRLAAVDLDPIENYASEDYVIYWYGTNTRGAWELLWTKIDGVRTLECELHLGAFGEEHFELCGADLPAEVIDFRMSDGLTDRLTSDIDTSSGFISANQYGLYDSARGRWLSPDHGRVTPAIAWIPGFNPYERLGDWQLNGYDGLGEGEGNKRYTRCVRKCIFDAGLMRLSCEKQYRDEVKACDPPETRNELVDNCVQLWARINDSNECYQDAANRREDCYADVPTYEQCQDKCKGENPDWNDNLPPELRY